MLTVPPRLPSALKLMLGTGTLQILPKTSPLLAAAFLMSCQTPSGTKASTATTTLLPAPGTTATAGNGTGGGTTLAANGGPSVTCDSLTSCTALNMPVLNQRAPALLAQWGVFGGT